MKSPFFSPRGRRALLAMLALSAAILYVQAQRGRPSDIDDAGDGADRWEVDQDHPQDHFTFVRLLHTGHKNGMTDFPKAEINLTNRLQQLTAWQVNPKYLRLQITDPSLHEYPFAFMTNVRNISFDRREAEAIRNYLDRGGFLMIDDFWGDGMWDDWKDAMKEVYPDKDPAEIRDLNHPIFNGVFKLDKIPQIPSIDSYGRTGLTYEDTIVSRLGASVDEVDTPHFQAWYDDKGRMVVLACHNNDIADGWEEEQTDPEFFKTFSEKYSFPIGINILFYVMTH